MQHCLVLDLDLVLRDFAAILHEIPSGDSDTPSSGVELWGRRERDTVVARGAGSSRGREHIVVVLFVVVT